MARDRDPEPLPIVATVTDVKGEVLNTLRYNYHCKRDRIKLSRTAWWALHSGHTITTRPV